MGLISYLKNTLLKSGQSAVLTADEEQQLLEQLTLRQFSIESAIGLIAKVGAMAQFNFRKDGELVRAEDWFRWNYEPNRDQNKQQFIYELFRKLFWNGEAVVVRRKSGMYVADSFQQETVGFGESVFYGIEKDGYELQQRYSPSDIYYYTYQDKRMRAYLEETAMQYANLLSIAEQKYRKNNTQKGILRLNTGVGGAIGGNQQEEKDQNYGQTIAKFLNSDKSSVMTMRRGFEYEELGKYHTQQSAEDIIKLTNEVFGRTAEAFHIPTALLLGNGEATATKDNINQLLNFAVRPLLDQIETEGTRKEIGIGGIKQGITFEVDDSTCRRIDPLEFSEAIDKCIACGAFCIDEVRTMFKHAPLNTAWSKRHYLTSNYKPIEASGKEEEANGNNDEQSGDNQSTDGGRSGTGED